MKPCEYHILPGGFIYSAFCVTRWYGEPERKRFISAAAVESHPAFPDGFCKTCVRIWEKERGSGEEQVGKDGVMSRIESIRGAIASISDIGVIREMFLSQVERAERLEALCKIRGDALDTVKIWDDSRAPASIKAEQWPMIVAIIDRAMKEKP